MGSMGSYSQVVVGGMLLVVAFFFGRYINQQPITETTENDRQELVGALESPDTKGAPVDSLVADADAQKSLRERILSQRAQTRQPKSGAEPAATNQIASSQNPTQPQHTDAIVEPDFSHLQSFESAPPIRLPKQPASELADTMPKTDDVTRPKELKQMTGRFSINRPEPDQMRPLRNVDNRYEIVAERLPRSTNARPIVNNSNDFSKSRVVNSEKQTADNPRHRMVPVRERRGNWNPEPKDYVSYTTVFGDTLHNLSTKFFGTPDRYLDIYLANRQIMKSPSDVPVNTEIRIPVLK